MKKIYEVPAMEIVRLDASENIAKLPTDSGSASTTANSDRVTTTTKTTNLLNAILLGGGSSNGADA